MVLLGDDNGKGRPPSAHVVQGLLQRHLGVEEDQVHHHAQVTHLPTHRLGILPAQKKAVSAPGEGGGRHEQQQRRTRLCSPPPAAVAALGDVGLGTCPASTPISTTAVTRPWPPPGGGVRRQGTVLSSPQVRVEVSTSLPPRLSLGLLVDNNHRTVHRSLCIDAPLDVLKELAIQLLPAQLLSLHALCTEEPTGSRRSSCLPARPFWPSPPPHSLQPVWPQQRARWTLTFSTQGGPVQVIPVAVQVQTVPPPVVVFSPGVAVIALFTSAERTISALGRSSTPASRTPPSSFSGHPPLLSDTCREAPGHPGSGHRAGPARPGDPGCLWGREHLVYGGLARLWSLCHSCPPERLSVDCPGEGSGRAWPPSRHTQRFLCKKQQETPFRGEARGWWWTETQASYRAATQLSKLCVPGGPLSFVLSKNDRLSLRCATPD